MIRTTRLAGYQRSLLEVKNHVPQCDISQTPVAKSGVVTSSGRSPVPLTPPALPLITAAWDKAPKETPSCKA